MENIQETIAEETNQTTENTLPIGGNAGTSIIAFSETIQMPVIPKTLVINGVEVNNDQLKDKIANEIKVMKIDGLEDVDGLAKAEEELKKLSKLRTGSETWRTKTVMPSVNTFGKDLKSRIDEVGTICTDGETYLKSIIDPIKKAAEIALAEKNALIEKTALEREVLITQCGGYLSAPGTFSFHHDTAPFVLAQMLRNWNEEQWQIEYAVIKASWAKEQERLQAIEDDKKAEETKLQSQVADLNEERTEMRKEILDMKGFTVLENGTYTHVSGINVLPSQILNLSKDDWTALLNPPAKVEVITPKVEETIVEAPELDLPDIDLPADLPQSLPEVLVAEINKPEPEMVEPREDSETISCEFQFSKADPFLEFVIGNGFSMRLYPEELEKEALEGLETATNGIAVEGEEGNLLFALFQR